RELKVAEPDVVGARHHRDAAVEDGDALADGGADLDGGLLGAGRRHVELPGVGAALYPDRAAGLDLPGDGSRQLVRGGHDDVLERDCEKKGEHGSPLTIV